MGEEGVRKGLSNGWWKGPEKCSISYHISKQECHSHQQLQRSPGPSFLCSPHNESERQGAEARKRLYSGRQLTKKMAG